MEKAAGIAQGRKLPRLARRSFLQQSALRQRHLPRRTSGEKVLYFVDTYANHFDSQLAEALMAVLEHNGVAVFVPKDQLQAAMPMIAAGAIDEARDIAARNVALLAEHVRHGYTVVATEPSAALALPSPMQKIAFEQPNLAVMFFPFNLLPAVVVPLVLLAHLTAIRRLTIKNRNNG